MRFLKWLNDRPNLSRWDVYYAGVAACMVVQGLIWQTLLFLAMSILASAVLEGVIASHDKRQEPRP
jgi:hypothetical protein